jgi:serine/threonine protein kinase
MLTGQHPFKDATITQMILKHIHEPLPLLEEVPEHLRYDLDDLLYRATAKSPQERFQEVLDIATKFREIVHPAVPLGDSLVITPPMNEQRKLLEQHIDQLYHQMHGMFDKTSASLDTKQQSQLGQLKKQINYRVTGLNKLVQYVVPELPPILTIPAAPPYTLVGASDLYATTKALLLDDRSVTLLGPPGVGKTELAAGLARDSAIVEHFSGQVVWFPMSKETDVLSLLGEWLLAYNI